jgi:hypothetical protein
MKRGASRRSSSAVGERRVTLSPGGGEPGAAARCSRRLALLSLLAQLTRRLVERAMEVELLVFDPVEVLSVDVGEGRAVAGVAEEQVEDRPDEC